MEIVVRAVVVYLFLWILLRGIGKRELSEMTAFELVCRPLAARASAIWATSSGASSSRTDGSPSSPRPVRRSMCHRFTATRSPADR